MNKLQGTKMPSKFNYIFSKYGILFVLLFIIVVAVTISPVFLSSGNLLNIVRQVAVIGLLAVGMTFVIISGGVDISVGSILSLSGVVAVTCISKGVSIPMAMGFAVIVGAAAGAINGFFVTVIGGTMGSAFIVTFGSSTVFGAVALMVTNGLILQASTYSGYEIIGQGSIGFVPISTIILGVSMAAAQFLLSKTTFGRITYCIGINDEATRLSGIKIKITRLLVYTIAGFMAGIAALVLTSRVKSASPIAGLGYELDAIAAVVLGGTRMGGGSGSIWKTLIGVVIFGVLANALNVMGVKSYPQIIIRGVIILISILMDRRSSKIESEMLARS
ncbi:ABC transporter permease [Treponema primitia]|uniref:ABC transporter permease n=1 Tax=Treponema primitia TaxID=88058 RepID=UPI0002554EAB|nr:ABC transporter permease [Treponema primitia]